MFNMFGQNTGKVQPEVVKAPISQPQVVNKDPANINALFGPSPNVQPVQKTQV